MQLVPRLAITLAIPMLAACGVQHQNVRLSTPETRVNPAEGKPIVVAAVTDSRKTPDGATFAQGERTHNVGGVWRGGNGVAVDLGQDTVIEETREIVTQALRGMGYRVLAEGVASPDAPRVAINITQFDVDAPFNFWRAASYTQQMVADVGTDIEVKSGGSAQSFKATGHGTNIYQRVVPENWEAALNEAIAEYTKQFQSKMGRIE